MTNQISLPDEICINEMRIFKQTLQPIPIRKYTFDPKLRHSLGKPFRNSGYLSVFSAPNSVYVCRTKKTEGGNSPKELGLLQDTTTKIFDDLPPEIARRFLFTYLKRAAESLGIYCSVGWQLFSPKDKGMDNFDALDVDIREERDYYSIFINPSVLFLLRATKVDRNWLRANRELIRIVEAEDRETMKEKWGHSSHTGFVGLFSEIDDATLVDSKLDRHSAILLKRTEKAPEVLRYPAFALRIIARREEIEVLQLTKEQRRDSQPLSCFRLKKTLDWAKKLFPNNQLIINDRSIAVENRIPKYQKPVSAFSSHEDSSSIWFPDVKLLFDRIGNKTEYSQLKGLKSHGPLDRKDTNRPFTGIRPYLIVPNHPQLIEQTKLFCHHLANGYQKRTDTAFPDDSFDGMKPDGPFGVDFTLPTSDDIFTTDGTSSSYIQAANLLINKWVLQENKSGDRVVIAVVPDLYDGDQDDVMDDPYIELKKVLTEAGIPSQMLEKHHLTTISDTSIALGHLLWNFALDIYVKMGGKPWTLHRPIGNVNCLIGLGFGRDTSSGKNSLYVGTANVFDEAGQWLSLSSDDRELTNEVLQSVENKEYSVIGTDSFKLHQEITEKIVGDSLQEYSTRSLGQSAARVVLHKSGRIYESEALGFLKSLAANILAESKPVKFALVSIYKNHDLRLYGPNYPQSNLPLRNTVSKGSAYILNENAALLATTGKSPYSYIGIGTPHPIVIERYVPSVDTLSATGFGQNQMYSIVEICSQVLALTKLHWGATRSIRLPVTSEYAHRIARFVAKSRIRADLLLKMKKLWWV